MGVLSKVRGRVCTNRSDRHYGLTFPATNPRVNHASFHKTPDNPKGNPSPQTMSQLPLADATPLKVTGTLFKDLVFAFEQQDIPDGARTLRALRVSLLASLTSLRL